MSVPDNMWTRRNETTGRFVDRKMDGGYFGRVPRTVRFKRRLIRWMRSLR